MPLPDAVHEQVEWETSAAFADGFDAGYAAAQRDFAREWARRAGVEPMTKGAVVRWLVRTFDRNNCSNRTVAA